MSTKDAVLAALSRVAGPVRRRSAGLHCVKAVCTGLLPITFGHNTRRIDWARVARYAPLPLERLQSPDFLRPHTFP